MELKRTKLSRELCKNTEKDLERIKREPESVKYYIKKYIKVSEGSESGWENALR